MLIINADDWGRSKPETDAALQCHAQGRITSVSAMVFMEDSERAAVLANEHSVDVGLHLNFSEKFTAKKNPGKQADQHGRIVHYLKRNKYSQLLYNPFLRNAFRYWYEAQVAEFLRLYGKRPSHIDGHHHMHLCANLLWSRVVPAGVKMRRNFSFWPGEKSLWNRTYRRLVDHWLARKYHLADYFFDLSQSVRQNKMGRVTALARQSNVELMTHPILDSEFKYLMSDEFRAVLQPLPIGTYALLGSTKGSVGDVN